MSLEWPRQVNNKTRHVFISTVNSSSDLVTGSKTCAPFLYGRASCLNIINSISQLGVSSNRHTTCLFGQDLYHNGIKWKVYLNEQEVNFYLSSLLGLFLSTPGGWRGVGWGGRGRYFYSYKVSSVVAVTVLPCFQGNTPLMPAITHSAVAR